MALPSDRPESTTERTAHWHGTAYGGNSPLIFLGLRTRSMLDRIGLIATLDHASIHQIPRGGWLPYLPPVDARHPDEEEPEEEFDDEEDEEFDDFDDEEEDIDDEFEEDEDEDIDPEVDEEIDDIDIDEEDDDDFDDDDEFDDLDEEEEEDEID
jgi:hypothetical protein